jgi:hypothetical protein
MVTLLRITAPGQWGHMSTMSCVGSAEGQLPLPGAVEKQQATKTIRDNQKQKIMCATPRTASVRGLRLLVYEALGY